MRKKKLMYVVTMERKRIGVDKYYREDEKKAYEILRSLENMYPNAKISYGSEEIVIKETENE